MLDNCNNTQIEYDDSYDGADTTICVSGIIVIHVTTLFKTSWENIIIFIWGQY